MWAAYMLSIPNGYTVVKNRMELIALHPDIANMFSFSNP
jgi:hypothetical protein